MVYLSKLLFEMPHNWACIIKFPVPNALWDMVQCYCDSGHFNVGIISYDGLICQNFSLKCQYQSKLHIVPSIMLFTFKKKTMKIPQAIIRTTGPKLGLFVVILMHLQC